MFGRRVENTFQPNANAGDIGKSVDLVYRNIQRRNVRVFQLAGFGDPFGKCLDQLDMTLRRDGADLVYHGLVAHNPRINFIRWIIRLTADKLNIYANPLRRLMFTLMNAYQALDDHALDQHPLTPGADMVRDGHFRLFFRSRSDGHNLGRCGINP